MQEYIQSILPILLISPLAGFLICILLGSRMPKAVTGLIASLTIALNFGLTLSFYTQISGSNPGAEVNYLTWFKMDNISLNFNFIIDRLSVLMLLIITGVGLCIHIYSIGYMSQDKRFHRFFAYLNLFIFFMQFLVAGGNFLITFIGWEGVGLCSYLLIGFWYEKTDYNNAARKAFIMNRIGDLGMLLALFLIITVFNSLDYNVISEKIKTDFLPKGSEVINSASIVAITLLLFVGATGKSAQIPLYTWLPDAMAGPTPVSALIHAATMVTAGIFLIVRSHLLFWLAPYTMEIIMIIGLATSIFAATIGLMQNDIKKVLAYSTVSQLGLMFLALGLGAYTTAMFHLTTHAFFKALLFLGAGSVIHGMGEEQDIRRMGGLRAKMPQTFLYFLIATLAITGIPPLSGFFSKDEILAKSFEYSPLLWVLGVISATLTAVYMFRLLFLVFFGKFRGAAATEETESIPSESDVHEITGAADAPAAAPIADHAHHTPVTRLEQVHESPALMTVPLAILAILSAIGGFMGIPAVMGGTHKLNEWLAPILKDLPAGESHHLSVSLEIVLMSVSVGLAVIVMIICARIFTRKTAESMAPEKWNAIQRLLANKYYIDELYNTLFVKPIEKLSGFLHNVIDVGVVDGVVNLVGRSVNTAGNYVRRAQAGNIGIYLFAIVISVALMLLYNALFLAK